MKNKIQIIQNMGLRYTAYRIRHEVEKKMGFLIKRHPINPPFKQFIALKDWRQQPEPFFFEEKNHSLKPILHDSLKKRVDGMRAGRFVFFSKTAYDLGSDYNWITNPITDYKYDITKHWSEIEDISAKAGDIKFVWEKARFSWLYDVIRYDYHFEEDMAGFVFEQIDDFIAKNPINQGPNYKCSQEISLRILNWTFALYYYKNSPELTEERFQNIMNAIFWQLHHVYHHIDFSRIAVRNNHAITETMMLYLSGLLFPFMAETKKWSKQGKKWLEEEVAYQVYKDGTFLQFSMNYHRVVVQLLTWGIRLSELHNDKLKPVVYERALASLKFLETCMDQSSGKLPNYGSNDGALFFRLNEDDYRVYRSQLNDLKVVLNQPIDAFSESQFWYGFSENDLKRVPQKHISTALNFDDGGYAVIQEDETKTFMRCGSYKDRPAQADNNHVDIWHKGVNYFRDAGSYKYNTSKEELDFFMGTKGHNTVMLENRDQMLKGSRFIWFYWIKKSDLKMNETKDYYEITGSFEGFKQLKKGIIHQRRVRKYKGELHWLITDSFENADGLEKTLFWHPNPAEIKQIEMRITDLNKQALKIEEEVGWYSSYYGEKEESPTWKAQSKIGFITEIKIQA